MPANGSGMIGEETCHAATRAMLAYARPLARGEETPSLSAEAHGAAERLFVIQRLPDGGLSALGDGLDMFFGAGARGHDIATLFGPPDRRMFLALLDACSMAGEPGVVRALGLDQNGEAVAVEILVSPLPHNLGRGDRFFGHALAAPERAAKPIRSLTIGALLTPAIRRKRPSLRLVVSNPDA